MHSLDDEEDADTEDTPVARDDTTEDTEPTEDAEAEDDAEDEETPEKRLESLGLPMLKPLLSTRRGEKSALPQVLAKTENSATDSKKPVTLEALFDLATI